MTLEDFINTIMMFIIFVIMYLLLPNMTHSEILTLVTWVIIALTQWNIDGLQIIAGLVFICVLDWIQSRRMLVRIEHEETGNPVEHAETPTVEPPTLVQPFQESFPPEDNSVNARMPINSQTEEEQQQQQQLAWERERMNREKLKMQDRQRKEDVPELPRQPEDSLTKDQGQTVEQKPQSNNRQAHGIQGANCRSNQGHLMKHSKELRQVVNVNEEKQGPVAIREERQDIPNIPLAVSDEQPLPSDVQDTGPGDEGRRIARQELDPKIRDDSDMSSDDTEAELHPD